MKCFCFKLPLLERVFDTNFASGTSACEKRTFAVILQLRSVEKEPSQEQPANSEPINQ